MRFRPICRPKVKRGSTAVNVTVHFLCFVPEKLEETDNVSLPNRTLKLGARRLYKYDSGVKTLRVLVVEGVR